MNHDQVAILMAQERQRALDQSNQLTLGELLDELMDIEADPDCMVRFDFCDLSPTTCRSWRGIYRELAIDYAECNTLLYELIAELKEAVGATFDGYKGGEFTMTRDTPVWVDHFGKSSETAIVGTQSEVGVNGKAYIVYLETARCKPYPEY